MNDLRITPEAKSDLRKIKAYISEELESPKAASSTVRKIMQTIRILREHAMIGAPLSSIARVKSDYRFLVSGIYLIFYRVNGKTVSVVRIINGRRDYLRILLKKPADMENRNLTS